MSITPITHHDPNIAIVAQDEPGPGGAHHRYTVSVLGEALPAIDEHGRAYTRRLPVHHLDVSFQIGGLAEVGPNGVTNEALLEIVRHRLASFQQGPFACRENESALKHTLAALDMLQRRTAKRRRRGVEGQAVK